MSDNAQTPPSKITLKPYDWSEVIENDRLEIRAFCLTPNSETAVLRIVNYSASCYIELPSSVMTGPNLNQFRSKTWTDIEPLCKQIAYKLKEDAPKGKFFTMKRKLYYKKKVQEVPVLLLLFEKPSSLFKVRHMCEEPIIITNFDPIKRFVISKEKVKLRVWETDITTTRKMLTFLNLGYSTCMDITNFRKMELGEQVSNQKLEYMVDFNNIKPTEVSIAKEIFTYPLILVFDIECYSKNHRSMPCEIRRSDIVYMISVTTQVFQKRKTRKRYCIILGDVKELPDCEVITAESEIDAIKVKFPELVRRINPNIISGFNISGFDIRYMNERLAIDGESWPEMGMIKGSLPKVKDIKWKSSAFSHNNIRNITLEGRIILDMLLVARRDFKFLEQFTLERVSQYFLKRGKHDIKAKEMFEIMEKYWQMKAAMMDILGQYPNGVELLSWIAGTVVTEDGKESKVPLNEEMAEKIRVMCNLPEIVQFREFHYKCKDMINFYRKALYDVVRIGMYCVEDSELVMDLIDKTNQWFNLSSASDIMGVTINDLFTRGQQVRILSQIYNAAARKNFIITHEEFEYMFIQGATVKVPVPNKYKYVSVLDFNSMYPNNAIEEGVCWSTYIPPEEWKNFPEGTYRKTIVKQLERKELELEEDKDGFDDEEDDQKKKNLKLRGKKGDEGSEEKEYEYRWFLGEEGVLPCELKRLISERDKVKGEIKVVGGLIEKVKPDKEKPPLDENEYSRLNTLLIILDCTQNNLKVNANSMYGALGAQSGGKLPLPQGGRVITQRGRLKLKKMNELLENEITWSQLLEWKDSKNPENEIQIEELPAGVKPEDKIKGEIIYNDTDSSFVKVPGVDNNKLCIKVGNILSDIVTKEVRKTSKFSRTEHEKSGTLIIMTAKMYLFLVIDPKTYKYKFDERDILKRGITLAKRGECKMIKELYMRCALNLFNDVPLKDTLMMIIQHIVDMYSGKIPWEKFVVIRELGSNYKRDTFPTKVLADFMASQGRPTKPGDRLECLVVAVPGEKKVGPRLRDPESFIDRAKEGIYEPVDYKHYLENVIRKSVDKLLKVGYADEFKKIEYISYLAPRKRKPTFINEPIKMMCQFLDQGFDITGVVQLIVNPPPPNLFKQNNNDNDNIPLII